MLFKVATVSLFASLSLYVIISVVASKRLKDSRDFFHDTGVSARAVASLTAFSITLGTGLVYVLSQAERTGWLIFLTPFGVWLGYALIAAYYRKLGYTAKAEAPNIFYLMGPRSTQDAHELTTFGKTLSWLLALTYLLLLAFELQVGSGLILDSVLVAPTTFAYWLFAGVMFLTVAIYVTMGGIRAAISTDIAQIILVAFFVIAIAIIISGSGESSVGRSTQAAASDRVLQISSAALVLIMAITTQFYSIVNAHVGSSYSPDTQAKVFWWVGVFSGLAYVVVALVALSVGSPDNFGVMIRSFLASEPETGWSIFLVVAVFMGMAAVLLSTLDNMAVAVAQVLYENVLHKNPFHKTEDPGGELNLLRWQFLILSIVAMAIAMGFAVAFPDAFSLLLTILFAATVLSPIMAATAWISIRGRASLLHSRRFSWAVSGGIAVTWLVYFALTYKGLRQASVWVHLLAFGLASGLAIIDLYRSRVSGISARGGEADSGRTR